MYETILKVESASTGTILVLFVGSQVFAYAFYAKMQIHNSQLWIAEVSGRERASERAHIIRGGSRS